MRTTEDFEDGALRRVQRLLSRRWHERRVARLADLDARTMADIGIDRSEIASIEAEARGATLRTRLRIVGGLSHA
jgi:uncharacterized protein YjiS (DUF1127 family)